MRRMLRTAVLGGLVLFGIVAVTDTQSAAAREALATANCSLIGDRFCFYHNGVAYYMAAFDPCIDHPTAPGCMYNPARVPATRSP